MKLIYYVLILIVAIATACQPTETVAEGPTPEDHKLFHQTLRTHLDALNTKNFAELQKSLSPDGTMYMIRPNTPVIHSTASYEEYHQNWFQDDSWKLKGAITDSYVGTDSGIAVAEIRYEIPNRDGKSYWNEMTISYGLKKVQDNWYIIKDHSSSVRKSPGF